MSALIQPASYVQLERASLKATSGPFRGYTDAESRVHAVKFFSRGECEAALKVEGLQSGVRLALERRLRKLAKVVISIQFEDHGQDFLQWGLDAEGKVIDCTPFQGWLWTKYTVVNHTELRKGSKAVLDDGKFILYPLVKVQRFKGATS